MNNQLENRKKLNTKEKYDNFLDIIDIIFSFLLVCVHVRIYFLNNSVSIFRDDLKESKLYKQNSHPNTNINFNFIYLFTNLLLLKFILQFAFMHITPYILKKQYKNPNDEKNYLLRKKYIRKLATHLYKMIFYILITLFGYYVLNQTNFFPKSLLGHGYLPNMFSEDNTNDFFHTKPKYFDLYYVLNLAYFSVDAIWLLFIDEKQSDFNVMFFHHVCSISLIYFSYITNYSNIGSIVLFLHNESDIFVHLTRFLLQTDASEIIKNISGVILTINFIYIRQYVFYDVIYTIYFYTKRNWDNIKLFLWLFLVFLYLLHISWTIAILAKAWKMVRGVKLTHIWNYNDSIKNKEKEKINGLNNQND